MFIIDDSQFHGISFIPSFVVSFLNVCYVVKITQKQIILRQLLLIKMHILVKLVSRSEVVLETILIVLVPVDVHNHNKHGKQSKYDC